MKKLLVEIGFALAFGIGGFALIVALDQGCVGTAHAQDRDLGVLQETTVTPTEARVQMLSDGGCLFSGTARGTSTTGEDKIGTGPFDPFNGARCTTVRNATITSAKKGLGVGDGGAP